jgi:glyoxylase-like metal-dependent hydrolase (beta-lactamase superfamily II)
MSGRPVPVDEPLNDLDAVPFGAEARAVHVPGHTVGSIALYLPAKRAVIVGDALQYRLGWALSPPARGVTQEPETALQSLSRLLELDFDVICFSHFPPMRRGGHGALRRLLKRQDLDTPRKSGNS